MQKKTLLMLLALSFVFTAACSSANKYASGEMDKAQNRADAEMAEAEAKKDDAKDHAQARANVYANLAEGTLTVDTDASKLEWYGSKQTGGHDGGFKDYTGTLSFGADGKIGKIDFEVDTTSIYSDVDQLTEHLKSADFFEVETYPTASFKSTDIVANTTDLDSYTVNGHMTIKDVTHRISFPATIGMVDGKLQAKAQFDIDRTEYGIVYEGKADDLINKEVTLKLDFIADVPALN